MTPKQHAPRNGPASSTRRARSCSALRASDSGGPCLSLKSFIFVTGASGHRLPSNGQVFSADPGRDAARQAIKRGLDPTCREPSRMRPPCWGLKSLWWTSAGAYSQTPWASATLACAVGDLQLWIKPYSSPSCGRPRASASPSSHAEAKAPQKRRAEAFAVSAGTPGRKYHCCCVKHQEVRSAAAFRPSNGDAHNRRTLTRPKLAAIV